MHRVNLHCRHRNRKRVLHMQLPFHVHLCVRLFATRPRENYCNRRVKNFSKNRISFLLSSASRQSVLLLHFSQLYEYRILLRKFEELKREKIEKSESKENLKNRILKFYYHANWESRIKVETMASLKSLRKFEIKKRNIWEIEWNFIFYWNFIVMQIAKVLHGFFLYRNCC